MPFFASPSSTAAASSSSRREAKQTVETWEFSTPRWFVALGLLLLTWTLTIVYRCDHIGPDEYNFGCTFCLYYITLWLVTVHIACVDTNLRTTTEKEI